MTWHETLAHLETLLQEKQYQAVLQQMDMLDLKDVADVNAHLRMARISEQIGQSKRAMLEYNLALRDQTDSPDIIKRLLELHNERGDIEQSEKLCQRLLQLQPNDVDAALCLGQIFTSTGRTEAAQQLYESVAVRVNDVRLRDALRQLQLMPRVRRAPHVQEDPLFATAPVQEMAEETLLWHPTDMDCIAMAHLFAGREGVYARQWRSDTGKYGYTPVYEPFTPTVARHHLLGNYTVGIYPLRMDHTVLFLAFDLDIAKTMLQRHAASDPTRGLDGLLRTVHSVARQILDAAAMFQIPAYLEDSGWKGRHLWIFFEEPIPAASARRLGQFILSQVGGIPAEIQLEVFPKQSNLQRGQLGNLIKLPLGIHRVTGRRCVWLQADGKPVAQPFQPLHQISRVSRQLLRDVLAQSDAEARWRNSIPPVDVDGSLAKRDTPPPASVSSEHTQSWQEPSYPVSPPLAEFPADLSLSVARRASGHTSADIHAHAPKNAHPGFLPQEVPHRNADDIELQWVLRGCHVLRELFHRATSAAILSQDEQHVVTYTVGHLTHGSQVVNEALSSLLNVDSRSLLKSPLRGHPMSCPKIRARLPELTSSVDCHCEFAPSTGMYPNPLLHLQSLRARGVLHTEMDMLSPLQIESMVADLFRAHRDLMRLQSLIQDMEGRLRAFMNHQHLEHLDTQVGRLSLSPNHQLQLSIRSSLANMAPSLPETNPSASVLLADASQSVSPLSSLGAIQSGGAGVSPAFRVGSVPPLSSVEAVHPSVSEQLPDLSGGASVQNIPPASLSSDQIVASVVITPDVSTSDPKLS